MDQSTEAVATRFFAAIERGDLEGVRELYAPDVRVWHNVTGRTQSRDENLRLLTFFASRVADRRYEVLARDHFPGGFVQRHVLHGKLASGETVAAPVCLVDLRRRRPDPRALRVPGSRDGPRRLRLTRSGVGRLFGGDLRDPSIIGNGLPRGTNRLPGVGRVPELQLLHASGTSSRYGSPRSNRSATPRRAISR